MQKATSQIIYRVRIGLQAKRLIIANMVVEPMLVPPSRLFVRIFCFTANIGQSERGCQSGNIATVAKFPDKLWQNSASEFFLHHVQSNQYSFFSRLKNKVFQSDSPPSIVLTVLNPYQYPGLHRCHKSDASKIHLYWISRVVFLYS